MKNPPIDGLKYFNPFRAPQRVPRAFVLLLQLSTAYPQQAESPQ